STSCGFSVGTNWFNVTNGALYPINSTLDFLVGGQSTASAKFGFLNVNSGTPTASISAITTNNALSLDANGNISTTNRQTLTIGSASTGNIVIDSPTALNLNTVNNAPITTGTGLTTLGGNLQLNGSNLKFNNANSTVTLGV